MSVVESAVYVSLGSNVGDRQSMLSAALTQLAAMPESRVVAVSSLYDTAAVGGVEQARFLNVVAALDTDLPPAQLLWHCMLIEQRLGRVRTRRWGPRSIDIDILLYGDEVIEDEELSVPHPEMLRRAFVLVPLSELAPELVHPVTGCTILAHVANLDPEADVQPQGRLTL